VSFNLFLLVQELLHKIKKCRSVEMTPRSRTSLFFMLVKSQDLVITLASNLRRNPSSIIYSLDWAENGMAEFSIIPKSSTKIALIIQTADYLLHSCLPHV